ncbi:hypothetical protein ANCCAN_30188, partial [Ancylostoma caninum]
LFTFVRHNHITLATTAAAVLSNLVKEIRNETVWSDQSVCGTVQLACAIALRALAVSPADHLNITNVEVDVDKVVDRAIKNLAMVFIRHGVIRYVFLLFSHIPIFLLLLHLPVFLY